MEGDRGTSGCCLLLTLFSYSIRMEETILELGKALKMPEHCICIMVGPGLEIRQDWKFARIGNAFGPRL